MLGVDAPDAGGQGFKEDVTSAPNTTIILRTRDEETARYFIRASAQDTVPRRSYSLAQQRLFVHEWYEKTGAAVEREDKEYRVTDAFYRRSDPALRPDLSRTPSVVSPSTTALCLSIHRLDSESIHRERAKDRIDARSVHPGMVGRSRSVGVP